MKYNEKKLINKRVLIQEIFLIKINFHNHILVILN